MGAIPEFIDFEPPKMPKFAVLEHAWNGVHYDVMLEYRGVLRTWAVDEWIQPGMSHRARPLPDHRLAYLEYEGPISEDRGWVRRVDRGDYEPVMWESERVEVKLSGAVFRGVLRLAVGCTREAEGEPDWILCLGNLD